MRNLRNFNKNARRDGKTAEQTLKEFGLSGDYEKYAGMDEDGLIAELMKSVREAKANGTYNPEQMQAFIALASPSLLSPRLRHYRHFLHWLLLLHLWQLSYLAMP